MDYADHVAHIERASRAIATAIAAGPLDAPVPTCPEWAVADLATHVGGFAGFWTHVLCEGTGADKPAFQELPASAGPEEAGQWFARLGAELVAALRATPPATPVWTWADDDRSATFVARRSAHELSVHCLDAELARGSATPIDAALAVDGIEEIFMMIAHRPGSGRGDGQTLHLHATDREAEWFATLGADGLNVERRHAKADLALRGGVADLELELYQRPPLGDVERLGDQSVLDAWYRVFTFS